MIGINEHVMRGFVKESRDIIKTGQSPLTIATTAAKIGTGIKGLKAGWAALQASKAFPWVRRGAQALYFGSLAKNMIGGGAQRGINPSGQAKPYVFK